MSNIDKLDRRYASLCQERVIQLQTSLRMELDKARAALGEPQRNSGSNRVVTKQFGKLWGEITTNLEAVVRELRKNRDAPDNNFKELVDLAVQACRDNLNIPSEKEIDVLRDANKGAYDVAYSICLNQGRTRLSAQFLTLDNGLKQSLEQTKCLVAQVLAEKGRLNRLSIASGSDFLKEIWKIIPDDLVILKNGFHILSMFDLSYRGLIQHRIRRHLDDLTPDSTPRRLSQHPEAQEIKTYLEDLLPQAIYRCNEALKDILSEPNQAAFAIVEEFVDQVLRSEGSEEEWRTFLDDMKDLIWPEEFAQLGENNRVRQEWVRAVEQVSAIANSASLRFLN